LSIHNKKETRAYFRRKEYNKIEGLLKDWYGGQRAANELIPRLPDAVTLSSTLDQLLSGVMTPDQKKLADLKENWALLVGEEIFQISRPVSMRGDLLYVEVKHNAWLRELSGLTKDLIITNINKFCGEKFCADIRFTPAGRGK